MVITKGDVCYVIEAKINGTTAEAIEQIEKKYIPQLTQYKEIVKIGINWNKKK